MDTSDVCKNSENKSFPIKTTINDICANYKNKPVVKPNFKTEFSLIRNLPVFEDLEGRLSGNINLNTNCYIATYNDNTYEFLSAQICFSTHSDWLLDCNTKEIINNKIDFIVTLVNNNGINPKYIFHVIPLIIDDSQKNDNPFLLALANKNTDLTQGLTLESIMKIEGTGSSRAPNYLWYLTCLEPTGDNAFVNINVDGLKISEDLYYSLLSVWTGLDMNMIQQNKDKDVKTYKNNLCKQQTNTLADLQNQLNELLGTITSPGNVNKQLDTWPTFVLPNEIINKSQATVITSFKDYNIEGFENYRYSTIENFDVNANPGSNVIVPLTNIQCKPLDIDAVTNRNNAITFDSEGNTKLSDIQIARNKDREGSTGNQKELYSKIQPYVIWVITVLILMAVIFYGFLPSLETVQDHYSSSRSLLPKDFTSGGLIFIIGIIFLLAGILIGAAVMSA